MYLQLSPREKKSETGDGESSGSHQRSDEVQSQFRHLSFSQDSFHDLRHLLFLALGKQTPRLKEKDDKCEDGLRVSSLLTFSVYEKYEKSSMCMRFM